MVFVKSVEFGTSTRMPSSTTSVVQRRSISATTPSEPATETWSMRPATHDAANTATAAPARGRNSSTSTQKRCASRWTSGSTAGT
jgi:hypothetical protein